MNNIQSLSIAVPALCLNDCCFCVAKMHSQDYPNMLSNNKRFYHLYIEDFRKRLIYVRERSCDSVVLTGDGEPLLNWQFLKDFGLINKGLPSSFKHIELQTSGTTLEDWYLRFLREHVGVTTISLSLSDMFDNVKNAQYNRTKQGYEIDIDHLCSEIKRYDFNLRLSLNMTKTYECFTTDYIFHRAKNNLKADQITFRILYESGLNTPQDQWIQQNRVSDYKIKEINEYIKLNGHPLERLSFGAMRYSVNGMSVVVDEDCMNTEVKEELKYMILRPNCKLYTKWDDQGSLVF